MRNLIRVAWIITAFRTMIKHKKSSNFVIFYSSLGYLDMTTGSSEDLEDFPENSRTGLSREFMNRAFQQNSKKLFLYKIANDHNDCSHSSLKEKTK